MRGDKLVIDQEHYKASRQLMTLLWPVIRETQGRFILTVAGESGSGKSEVAAAFSELLSENSIKSVILQQDDYFVYPPKTNARMRRQDIGHVGVSEVKLDLLDQHLRYISQLNDEIEKPLVIFDDDMITTEVVKLGEVKVVIVEGTYTSLLKNAHERIFIDRTYIDTKERRQRRAREEQDNFLEKVLKLEHRIISAHKDQASIIITKDYEARRHEHTSRQ